MTHLGPSTLITGDVICENDDLLIDGHVQGRVRVRSSALVIGAGAHVNGDVRGSRITVAGAVQGSIWASERIEVTATARVHGTLSANRIVIADGATVNARIDMDQRTIAARVAKYRAEQEGALA